MANVKISWTQPSDVSDQDAVRVFRVSGDQTAATDSAFIAAGTQVASEAPNVANAAQDFTELNVPSGTWTYGAFSYNAAGYGPGDIADSTITIS